MWSEQDGAKAHTSQSSLNVLRLMWFSLRGDVGPPVRSPDLSIIINGLFLGGCFKEKILKHCSQTLPELRDRILEEVMNICNVVIYNFRRRLQQNVDTNGLLLWALFFKYD